MQKKLFHHSRFQFISHFNDRYSYLDGIKMALEEDAVGYNFA